MTKLKKNNKQHYYNEEFEKIIEINNFTKINLYFDYTISISS